jgi:hypothetical protein
LIPLFSFRNTCNYKIDIMLTKIIICVCTTGFLFLSNPLTALSQSAVKESVINEKLVYHQIHLNQSDQTIIPWYSADLGKSYDFVIGKVWDFWYNMRNDKNGLPYYMNHQVWRGDFNDRRGIGGDQFAMALSSWNLLYGYSGDEKVKEEMKFIADYYLTHSLSPADAKWPNIPYPYNTLIYSGIYDGDMVIGKDFTQPDKAGSFGLELVKLYKMTNTTSYPNITDTQYLNAAIKIANTLVQNIKDGDENNSPLPFKVNAITGEIGHLKHNSNSGQDIQLSSYTSNWAGTMELFMNLIELKSGDINSYQSAFDKLLKWMKNYPLKTNKWGPFFEDVPGWSDTQINAITFAQFMMNHQEFFPDWKSEVKGIFTWVHDKLGNKEWEKYGVTVVNEQTAYQVPGNSHSSREASAELQYAAQSGDQTFVKNNIRQLNWATYMVDNDGKNCYPRDDVWMTDGYGDYVRHYLRAMAALPELAPKDKNHLLSTTSVVQGIEYAPYFNLFKSQDVPDQSRKATLINYQVFDTKAVEVFRLTTKPSKVLIGNKEITQSGIIGDDTWTWQELKTGGVLTVKHTSSDRVIIMK